MKFVPNENGAANWESVVGAPNVIADPAALREAETGTYHTGNRVPAIVRPANRREVQECLRVANRCKISVYPVSGGKNWGYGSRMPSSDNCVILDLSRMNRIVEFNEELGYVTLEPGVTQAQLQKFLQERGSKLWMDSTGASPECSIIGNTVERGFGHTPYGDHFGTSCGLEVVLPDGSVIETGMSRFESAHAGPTYRWGVGPFLDGLFSQSNFGIVTRMTQWLMPAPEYFQAYYFKVERDEGLVDIINALRPLRLNGTIRSASHIVNDYKVVSALQQYPYDRMNGQTPLRGPVLDELRKGLKIGMWNGSGALYGTKGQVAEARRLLKAALKGKAHQLVFLDDAKLKLAARLSKPFEMVFGWNLEKTLALLKPVYGLMKGIPTDHPLSSTYWRKRTPPPAQNMHPDRDGCGLIWCNAICPTDGAHARRVATLATSICLECGFEPAISITMLTERTLANIISLAYDRSVDGEDARAFACYKRLLAELAKEGYYPYRLAVGAMGAMNDGSDYNRILSALKDTLDPNNVLSPGRYIAPAATPAAVTLPSVVA